MLLWNGIGFDFTLSSHQKSGFDVLKKLHSESDSHSKWMVRRPYVAGSRHSLPRGVRLESHHVIARLSHRPGKRFDQDGSSEVFSCILRVVGKVGARDVREIVDSFSNASYGTQPEHHADKNREGRQSRQSSSSQAGAVLLADSLIGIVPAYCAYSNGGTY